MNRRRGMRGVNVRGINRSGRGSREHEAAIHARARSLVRRARQRIRSTRPGSSAGSGWPCGVDRRIRRRADRAAPARSTPKRRLPSADDTLRGRGRAAHGSTSHGSSHSQKCSTKAPGRVLDLVAGLPHLEADVAVSFVELVRGPRLPSRRPPGLTGQTIRGSPSVCRRRCAERSSSAPGASCGSRTPRRRSAASFQLGEALETTVDGAEPAGSHR